MRLGWERPGSLALRRVLTNRMRELFTYGSVGGAGGNSGSYPAPNGGVAFWFQDHGFFPAVGELLSFGSKRLSATTMRGGEEYLAMYPKLNRWMNRCVACQRL